MRLLFLALFALSVGHVVHAQQPVHLDFEQLSVEGPTRAWDWAPYAYAPGASVFVDSTVSKQGRRSLRITLPTASEWPHAVATYLRPLAARGKRARVTGWVRTDSAGIVPTVYVQAQANFEVLARDSVIARDLPPNAWMRVETAIAVPRSAETLVIIADAAGQGTAWFDDMKLFVGGEQMHALPIARAPTAAELDWLAARAHPLRTVDATAIGGAPDLADLAALGEIVGDARVVALGESTHGTSEFFRFKHRALEYLVREQGFRVFAIEDQQLDMERANAYVQGGPGTVEEAMRGMFSVWSTHEVRDLIAWIRAYNAEHPDDMVQFVGFDMQVPTRPIDSLLAFTERYEPTLTPTLAYLLGDFREAWRQNQYPQYYVGDSTKHRWADATEAAWRLVAAREASWLARATSDEERDAVAWAVQNARVAAQAGTQSFSDFAQRDSSMAQNIRWHLDRMGPNTRAVVWAHDQHISKGLASSYEGNYFTSSMGRFLREMYGPDYVTIGLMGYDGRYTGIMSMYGGPRDLIEGIAFTAPAGSYEDDFRQVADRLGTDALLLDLRGADREPGGRLLFERRAFRYAGYAMEDYGFHGSVELGHQFDGMLFVRTMTGTRPLGEDDWPRR